MHSHRGKWRDRAGIFHPLVYSPNAHTTSTSPGQSQELPGFPHEYRVQYLEPSSAALPGAFAESWTGSTKARNLTGTFMGCQLCRQRFSILQHYTGYI